MNEKGQPIVPPILTAQQALRHLTKLYLSYVPVIRALDDCYDQCIQPQKRRLMRVTLDTTIVRLLQIRADIVRLNVAHTLPDYPQLVKSVIENNSSLIDLDIPIPRYLSDRGMPIDNRNNTRNVYELCLEECLPNYNVMTSSSAGESSSGSRHIILPHLRMSRETAIRMIARAERGRQGALRARLMRELRAEDIIRRRRERGEVLSQHRATVMIQSLWRGYSTRQKVKQQRISELIFLSMKPPSYAQPKIVLEDTTKAVNHNGTTTATATIPSQPAQRLSQSQPIVHASSTRYDPLLKESLVRRSRKDKQYDNELLFQEAIQAVTREMTETESAMMSEALWKERYDWFVTQRTNGNNADLTMDDFYIEKYPDSPEAKQALIAQEAASKKKGKKKGKDAAEEKNKADEKKTDKKAAAASDKDNKKKDDKKDKKGNNADEVDPATLTSIGPSSFVHHLHECIEEYRRVWASLDESDNPTQSYSVELIKQSVRPIVETKVRAEVDSRMNGYLLNVKAEMAALKGDKKKGKKGGKKGAKKEEAPAKAPEEEAKVVEEESKEQLQPPAAETAEVKEEIPVSPANGKKGKKGGSKADKNATKKCCERFCSVCAYELKRSNNACY